MGMDNSVSNINTKQQGPEGTLFILNTKEGAEAEQFVRVGFVVRNQTSQFESYNVVAADGSALSPPLSIDLSKAGDLYLKTPNPNFDPNVPRDMKENNPYNIVTRLYDAQSKKTKEPYYRATVGQLGDDVSTVDGAGKRTLKAGCIDKRLRYFMFKPNHGQVVKKAGALG